MIRKPLDPTSLFASRRQTLGMLLALAASSLGAVDCVKHNRKPPVPTKTERGEKVETGSPIYDEYFDTVHELHVLVASARLEQRDARSTLASMIDLLPTADEKQLLSKLEERAPQLPGMHLSVDDKVKPNTAKLALAQPATRVDESVKGLMTVMEATATASLSISHRMGELPERAHRMHNVGATLIEGAGKDFASRPIEERNQIEAELQAAQELLVGLAQDSQDISDASHAFVVRLQEVLEKSGSDYKPDKPEQPRAQPKPPKRNQPSDFNP